MPKKNILKEYFPMIRTREEILEEINNNPMLYTEFSSYSITQQEEFLDYCTGVKGIKILYDSFFKKIMNPESTPDRLNDFLSVLMGERVKILFILPNDSTRIASENTLLITDIVVQLENGSIVNIEIQKIGYYFTGERASCYSADLLLRQYKRVRDEKGKYFSYRDIKPVVTIVLYEKSPAEFHKYSDIYIHRAKSVFDSGLDINLLQKYIFVPLDIFKKKQHNNPIVNKLDAWLAFLVLDAPDDIVNLINAFPEFKPLYEHIYQMCRNMEDVMGLFSEELKMLDDNTVKYMIDIMQEELNAKNEELDAKNEELNAKDKELKAALARIKKLEEKS